MEYDCEHWKIVGYDKKALEILKNVELNEQQKNELDRCMKEIKTFQADVFPDMYKLFVNEMAFVQISKYYNRSASIIHRLFKELGISRNLKEAQEIAGKYRDYDEIRKTFKRTMKERYVKTQLFGSDVENLIRVEINQYLDSILDSKYEVVIGINSLFSAGELDIPIIIIKGNEFYKFGIEVGNYYIHDGRTKGDDLKISKFERNGYNVMKFDTNATVYKNGRIRNYSKLCEDVKLICRSIKKDIVSKIEFGKDSVEDEIFKAIDKAGI